jgi:phosphoserine phosphatase
MSSAALPHTVVIHFSGPDKPGLTAELTSVIAGYDVQILDIG